MFGQEMLIAFDRLEELVDRYPVRGLKGAVGTQLDQLTLLGGDADKVASIGDARPQAPRLPGLARRRGAGLSAQPGF